MTKEQIIIRSLKIIRKLNRIPNRNDFLDAEITRDMIRHHFVNLTNLINECKKKETTAFDGFTDQEFFTEENFSALEENVSKHSTFVIGTAVTGCKPHTKFLNAINTFNGIHDGFLLIPPCSDPAKKGANRWTMNSKIPAESLVFKDLVLNSNLMISEIKMSAKQLNPLTGAGRSKGKPKSTIIGSPKQFLEYKSVKNDPSEIPRAIMSTGALTLADYTTERYMSERLSYFADIDHTYGAIIVELDNELGKEKFFHFRQIQTNASGAFIDLGIKYKPNNDTVKAKTSYLELGDWHLEDSDASVEKATFRLIQDLKPELIGVQDFFSFNAVNYHESKQLITKSIRAKKGELDLQRLRTQGQNKIKEILNLGTHKILYKWGNHDDFLVNYLQECRYKHDVHNQELALELALEIHKGRNPIIKFLDLPKECLDRVIFLEADSSYMVHEIEVGAHGHLGPGGKRSPTIQTLDDVYYKSISGDKHKPGIFRGSKVVGTSGKLKMGYNKGPGGWMHTHCAVYEDGSSQLINIINGKYKA